MAFGLDYSDVRPSHAAMKTAGVRFVMRYIGSQVRGPGRDAKWLSPSEARSLHADGIDVGVVFETTAQRADGGRAAGLADAHTAVAELAYCGLPADLPVYFAVDWDADVGPLITAYFKAVAEVLGLNRVGAYGGYRVIKALFDARLITYGWQTYAWSGGRWDPRNHLEQYSNNRGVGGESVDYDRSMKDDFGQWPAKAAPAPSPQEDTMLSGSIPAGAGPFTPILCAKFTKLYFGFDNTYTNADLSVTRQAPAQFRVAMHQSGRKGVVQTVTVGAALTDTKGWADNVGVDLPSSCDRIDIVRLDDGTRPVGFCVI